MKILIVTHNFPPVDGGIATHVYELAKNLTALGHEPIVLAPRSKLASIVDSHLQFPVVRMLSSSSKYIRLLLTALYIFIVVLLRHPQVVYSSHWKNAGVASALCSLISRKPLFQAVHGSEVTRLRDEPLSLHLFRWVVSVARGCVVSGVYQVNLLRDVGIPREKLLIAPQGVDLKRFSERTGKDDIVRARHNVGAEKILLTVARLVERKGHDTVIRALPKVLTAEPNTAYLIVGKGPWEAHLKEMSRAYGVSDNVVFCGYVSDEEIPLYYQSCDLFVMMSRDVDGDVEGFGISYIEAAACGKAVIGGRSGGIPEVIDDGVTGYLVDPLDSDELSEVLIKTLQDQEATSRMGDAGRTRVIQRYDFKNIVENILSYFQMRS